MPEHRRRFAEEMVAGIFRKFYGESPERVEAIASVALDAFESDDYWLILKNINDATRADASRLAGVLSELGLVDVALVAYHTKRRLAFLDQLELLMVNPDTLEGEMHRAIENNLWFFGFGHQLIASNKTLAKIIADWLDKEFVGPRASKRPDLFLAVVDRDRHLLVEFKRPSHAIDREDERQAIEYRDDLQPFIPGKRIDILAIGGSRSTRVAAQYNSTDLRVASYGELIAESREGLTWLLRHLSD
jgi:hypothetical protein